MTKFFERVRGKTVCHDRTHRLDYFLIASGFGYHYRIGE